MMKKLNIKEGTKVEFKDYSRRKENGEDFKFSKYHKFTICKHLVAFWNSDEGEGELFLLVDDEGNQKNEPAIGLSSFIKDNSNILKTIENYFDDAPNFEVDKENFIIKVKKVKNLQNEKIFVKKSFYVPNNPLEKKKKKEFIPKDSTYIRFRDSSKLQYDSFNVHRTKYRLVGKINNTNFWYVGDNFKKNDNWNMTSYITKKRSKGPISNKKEECIKFNKENIKLSGSINLYKYATDNDINFDKFKNLSNECKYSFGVKLKEKIKWVSSKGESKKLKNFCWREWRSLIMRTLDKKEGNRVLYSDHFNKIVNKNDNVTATESREVSWKREFIFNFRKELTNLGKSDKLSGYALVSRINESGIYEKGGYLLTNNKKIIEKWIIWSLREIEKFIKHNPILWKTNHYKNSLGKKYDKEIDSILSKNKGDNNFITSFKKILNIKE